jgi:hypothetical protein
MAASSNTVSPVLHCMHTHRAFNGLNSSFNNGKTEITQQWAVKQRADDAASRRGAQLTPGAHPEQPGEWRAHVGR